DHPGVHIGVVHATVDGPDLEPLADQPVATSGLDTLVESGIDYWALGHSHRRHVVHREPWVVHPGNTQARRATAHESGPKGAFLVEVDDGGAIAEPEFVSLERVRFDHVDFVVDGVADLTILRDRLVDLGRA